MFKGLFLNLVSFFGENFNDLMILFLILLTVYGFVKYDLLKLLNIRKSLARLNKGINAINGNDSSNIWKVDGLFSSRICSGLKNAWTTCYYDFMYVMNKEKTLDIKEYFNILSVITIPAGRKRAESVPGILSMTGILGTFLGIMAGFAGLGSAPVINEKDQLNRVSDIIAPSISIFIAAVILSILFQLFDRQAYQAAVSELNAFINNLSKKIPMATESGSLELLVREQRITREALEKMGFAISTHLSNFVGKELVPSIHKAFDDSIKSQVTPSIKSMSDMLYQMSEAAYNTQRKGMQIMVDNFVNKLMSTMGLEFEKLGANLKGIMEYNSKAADSINGLLEKLSGNAELQKDVNTQTVMVLETIGCYQRQFTDINSALVSNMESMKSYNEAMQGILISDRQTAEELDSQRQALSKESGAYFSKMDEQINRLLEDMNIQLDAAFSRFNEITVMAFERLDHSLNTTTEGMSNNMKSLTDSMDDQVRDISIYARGISEEVSELNSRLENALKEFGSQLNEGVLKTIEAFDGGLADICSRFGRVISDIKDSVEELPAIIEAMKGYKEDKREMVG